MVFKNDYFGDTPNVFFLFFANIDPGFFLFGGPLNGIFLRRVQTIFLLAQRPPPADD